MHELDLMGKLDEVGGPAYSSHLMSIIPTPLHAGQETSEEESA